jgi:hypothetical protein
MRQLIGKHRKTNALLKHNYRYIAPSVLRLCLITLAIYALARTGSVYALEYHYFDKWCLWGGPYNSTWSGSGISKPEECVSNDFARSGNTGELSTLINLSGSRLVTANFRVWGVDGIADDAPSSPRQIIITVYHDPGATVTITTDKTTDLIRTNKINYKQIVFNDPDPDGLAFPRQRVVGTPIISGKSRDILITIRPNATSSVRIVVQSPTTRGNQYEGNYLGDSVVLGDLVNDANQLSASLGRISVSKTAVPTNTPTPVAFEGLAVGGAFTQTTSDFTREATDDMPLPFITGVTVSNNTMWSNTGYKPCAIVTPTIMGTNPNAFSYQTPFVFPPNNPTDGYCIPDNYTNMSVSSTAVYNTTPAQNGLGQILYTPIIQPAITVSQPVQTTIDLPFAYTGGSWIKFKDTSVIRSVTDRLANNVPYIKDSFKNSAGVIDEDDGQEGGVIDENQAGAGGFVAGNIDIKPLGLSSATNSWTLPQSYALNPAFATNKLKDFVFESIQFSDSHNIPIDQGSNDIILTGKKINIVDVSGLAGATPNITSLSINPSGSAATLYVINSETKSLAPITLSTNTENMTLFVVSSNINIDPSVTELSGIFASTGTFDTGGGTNTLKIKGNIISAGGLIDMRDRQDNDHARPSMFVVFDFSLYQDLLPYIRPKGTKYMIDLSN